MGKKVWTEEMQEFLEAHYSFMSVKKIAQKLKVSEGTIYRRLLSKNMLASALTSALKDKQRPKAEYTNTGYLSLINN